MMKSFCPLCCPELYTGIVDALKCGEEATAIVLHHLGVIAEEDEVRALEVAMEVVVEMLLPAF